MFTSRETDIIEVIINMNYKGKIPTEKQVKVAIKVREQLIENSMPLQF